jgi:hypothetical protein
MGLFAVDGIHPFINDQRAGFEVTAAFADAVIGGILFEFSHEVHHSGEVNADTEVGGLDSKSDGQMAFAHARRPQEDDIFFLPDKLEGQTGP